MTPGLSTLSDKLRGTDILALLFLVSLCLLVPTNGLGSGGLQLALLWLLFRDAPLRRAWWQSLKPLILAALAFLLLLSVLSFVQRTALKDAWAVLRGLLFSLPALYVLQVGGQRLRLSGGLTVLVATALALAVLCINFQKYGIAETVARQWLDTAVHRNRFAVGVAVAFIIASALLLTAQRLGERLLFGFCAALLCLVAYINNSRGAILGMMAAGAALGFLWNWRLATVLALLAAGAGFALWESGVMHSAVTHNDSVDNGRLGLWHMIGERIGDNPWTGFGMHALPNDTELALRHPEINLPHPHSIYLELVYASGLVGVLFWLLWYGMLGRRVHQSFAADSLLPRYLGLALLAYVLVHGLVDFTFYSLGVATLLTVGTVWLAAPLRREA